MEIQETTEGRLGGTEVAISNIGERLYKLPDGSELSGLSARVSLAKGVALFVGKGSVVEIGTGHFEVVAVEKTAGQLGSVRFAEIQGQQSLKSAPGPGDSGL